MYISLSLIQNYKCVHLHLRDRPCMCALYIASQLLHTIYIRHLLLDPTSLAVDLDLWYGTAPMATCYVLSLFFEEFLLRTFMFSATATMQCKPYMILHVNTIPEAINCLDFPLWKESFRYVYTVLYIYRCIITQITYVPTGK